MNDNDDKIVTLNFGTDSKNQSNSHVYNNQTNPIYKKLYKLMHLELSKDKKDYKSHTKFRPKDIF